MIVWSILVDILAEVHKNYVYLNEALPPPYNSQNNLHKYCFNSGDKYGRQSIREWYSKIAKRKLLPKVPQLGLERWLSG